MKNSRNFAILKSALVLLVLGACSQGGQSPQYATGAEVEKRSRVEMVRIPYLVLAEKDGGSQLSDGTLRGLKRFMDTVDVRYGDVVVADQGQGVSAARIDAVASQFRRLGLAIGETDGVFGVAPAAGNLMIYVERYIVELPDCPDFQTPNTPDYQNAGSPNFGCATASSLGMMVANPRDLIDGQSDPSAMVEPQIRAAREVRLGGEIETGNR